MNWHFNTDSNCILLKFKYISLARIHEVDFNFSEENINLKTFLCKYEFESACIRKGAGTVKVQISFEVIENGLFEKFNKVVAVVRRTKWYIIWANIKVVMRLKMAMSYQKGWVDEALHITLTIRNGTISWRHRKRISLFGEEITGFLRLLVRYSYFRDSWPTWQILYSIAKVDKITFKSVNRNLFSP